jgi:hypothetical protein
MSHLFEGTNGFLLLVNIAGILALIFLACFFHKIPEPKNGRTVQSSGALTSVLSIMVILIVVITFGYFMIKSPDLVESSRFWFGSK